MFKLFNQIVPHLAITYTVMVGTNFSMNFTEVPCDETSRRCHLTIPNLSNSYNVSVMATNIYLALDLLHFILVRCYRSLQLDLYIIYVYFATTVVFLAPCTECNPADLGSNQTSLRGQGMVNVSNGLL